MEEEILLAAQACVSADGDCMVCRYDQTLCDGDRGKLLRLLVEAREK